MKAKTLVAVLMLTISAVFTNRCAACSQYTTEAILHVTPPIHAHPGNVVTLDGSDSYYTRPGGNIHNWWWDFDGDCNQPYPWNCYDYKEGDGEAGDGTEDGITTHIYNSPGIYTATLWVENSDDRIVSTSVEIYVILNSAPTPCIEVEQCDGGLVDGMFDACGDPDGDVVEYKWDLGEGDGYVAGDISIINPVFKFSGVHNIKLWAKDDDGATAEDVVDVNVVLPIEYPHQSDTGEYEVTWASADCEGVDHYELERSKGGGWEAIWCDTDDPACSGWELIYSGSATSHSENVQQGNYRYRVRYVAGGYTSEWTSGKWICEVKVEDPVFVDGTNGSDSPPNDGSTWALAFATIQKGIDTANAAGGGAVCVTDGTYSGPITLKAGVQLYGGFDGTETELDQRDWRAHETIISGGNHVVTGCNNAVIDGFTIRDGLAGGNGTTSASWGAGMYNLNVNYTLKIANCKFTNNTAVYGGGIYNYSSSPAITDCNFIANHATISSGSTISKGGGIANFNNSNPLIEDCVFSNNTVKDWNTSDTDYGAGVYNNASVPTLSHCTFNNNSGHGIYNENIWVPPTINYCTFNNNSAYKGAGIYQENCERLYVNNCNFNNNQATTDGGAIYSSSKLELTNCTFTSNNAGLTGNCKGGAVYNTRGNGGSLHVYSCTFIGNKAASAGGAFYQEGVELIYNSLFLGNSTTNTNGKGGGLYVDYHGQQYNCVFSGNSAAYGGGLCVDGSYYDYMKNCTFSKNTATTQGGGVYSIASSLPLYNCVLWGNTAGSGTTFQKQFYGSGNINYSTIQGWTSGGTGNNGDNPLFVDADGADNIAGTKDDDLHLQSESTCIDSANGTYALATDIMGLQRIDDPRTDTGAGTPTYVDRGAYEFGDYDYDGMPDWWENQYGLNPNDKSDADQDFDDDGFTNREEYLHNTDPTDKNSPGMDADHDGLTNKEEKALYTDPFNYDIDGDFLPDGYEWEFGLNPLGSNTISQDIDGDGLTLAYEVMFWTNPNVRDSDMDSANDKTEVDQGSCPRDASDGGQPPPADQISQIRLYLKEVSCPPKDPYNMMVGPVTHQLLSPCTESGTVYKIFRPGECYEVRIARTGNATCGECKYDASITAVSLPPGVVMTIDDPDGLLGNGRTYDSSTQFKVAYMCLVKIEVANIKFNHTAGDTADGINIREDGTTDINVPEWVKDGQNKSAAYKKSTNVTIKAKFTVSPSSITSAKISAATTNTTLGNLGEQTVNFSSGVSNPEYITFTPANSTPADVNKSTVTWQWKAKDLNGNSLAQYNINSSGPHTIYTVLGSPQFPQSEPWTGVLDKSCVWANKLDTPTNTIGAVTTGIYNSGFQYDNVSGSPAFYNSQNGKFKLGICLNSWGSGLVNCWDCAQMVVIFSNSLGCNIECYYITGGGNGFLLNYIQPIGRSWTNDPFTAPGRNPFSCHWTAWSNIYDACLLLDNDSDPTQSPHTGLQPQNMTFNAGTQTPYDDYRGKLVDPQDELSVSGQATACSDVE